MQPTEAELKTYLLDLLARREYSQLELQQKLRLKQIDPALVASLLDWLAKQGYQSEERFARQLIRAKLQKGYGSYAIAQFCFEHGVSKAMQQVVLAEMDIDWLSLAADSYGKKYAGKAIANFQDKQKRMRYLQSRGFDSAVIQQLFKQL